MYSCWICHDNATYCDSPKAKRIDEGSGSHHNTNKLIVNKGGAAVTKMKGKVVLVNTQVLESDFKMERLKELQLVLSRIDTNTSVKPKRKLANMVQKEITKIKRGPNLRNMRVKGCVSGNSSGRQYLFYLNWC